MRSVSRPSITAPISRKRSQSSVPLLYIVGGGFSILFLFGFIYVNTLNSLSQHQQAAAFSSNKYPPRDHSQKSLLRVPKVETQSNNDSLGGTLLIKTNVGTISIVLRPDWSSESCDYIHQLAKTQKCSPCNLYRADKPGILQGIMKDERLTQLVKKGPCVHDPTNGDTAGECPPHDPHCACHGPVMTHGMVGWAGGGTGPDFFVDTYKRPAKFWGRQHTVFGKIQDQASFDVIEHIYTLPTRKDGIMIYLLEPIHFEIEIQ